MPNVPPSQPALFQHEHAAQLPTWDQVIALVQDLQLVLEGGVKPLGQRRAAGQKGVSKAWAVRARVVERSHET